MAVVKLTSSRLGLPDWLNSSNKVGVQAVGETKEVKKSKEGQYGIPQFFESVQANASVYRQQESEARATILSQILEPAAADRLGRIRMVKESRATDVENRLIMLARSGQLRQKVTEDQLKDMLASLTEHQKETGAGLDKMKFVRKSGWDDDDLDDLLEG